MPILEIDKIYAPGFYHSKKEDPKIRTISLISGQNCAPHVIVEWHPDERGIVKQATTSLKEGGTITAYGRIVDPDNPNETMTDDVVIKTNPE